VSETLARVQALVANGEFEVSRHGLLELAADRIMLRGIVAGVSSAIAIEDYPQAQRGPSVLAFQRDAENLEVHVVWGIPKDARSPAVLITAYRPDPTRWTDDLMRRKR
jgi:hypothetical protein